MGRNFRPAIWTSTRRTTRRHTKTSLTCRATKIQRFTYIVPNHPERSLLFWKVNCSNPVVGGRMPQDGYPTGSTVLTTYQMAQIWDWIAEGAPVDSTDGVFQGTFDIRGLFVDEIFAGGFE